jgi:hypothetical protein
LVGRNAAIFLRETEAEQPDRRGLLVEDARKLTGLVPLMGIGLDFLLDKATHHLAKRLVLFGIEWALRSGALQHRLLPRDHSALLRPARTCVERLA